jgi:hypothetical protein
MQATTKKLKYFGSITELEIDIDLCDGDVLDAIATENRIALDWEQGGVDFHASLQSEDGVAYAGDFGDPALNPHWKMKATKYVAANNNVLLLTEWWREDVGDCGVCLFELVVQR